MEHPIRIEEEEGEETMADSTAARTRPGPARDARPDARRETETPRAELPEWLARELFKIFV